jgi:hypothetical protein
MRSFKLKKEGKMIKSVIILIRICYANNPKNTVMRRLPENLTEMDSFRNQFSGISNFVGKNNVCVHPV